jgi:DNA-binding transcriptional regulator LsrR (DeoR family)
MEKAEKDLNEARIAWAATVRDLGQAAVARELGLTSQGIAERLRVIEGKKTR